MPPTGRGGATRGRKYPAEILTADEARRLIRAASNRAPSGIRNRALLSLLYRSGLRISEALALRVKDVDLVAGTVRVLNGKGGRARTVGLDDGVAAVLSRWIDRRATLGLTGRVPLFCSITRGESFGKPLAPQYVRAMMQRLAVRAGIEKRVHPHGLRHTHAAELAAEGTPMNVIQAQLGHASLAVTDRYLRHVAPTALIHCIRQRDWIL
jgi:site-specific recombinase XerD